jgi:preprotein translocase subunit SecE
VSGIIDTVKSAPARARDNVSGSWNNLRTFLTEVRNELKRVTWPSRKEVYATTVVVIVTSVFFGVYLWALDMILTTAVGKIFQLFGAA